MKHFLVVLTAVGALNGFGQNDSIDTAIVVTGNAYEFMGRNLSDLLIINQRTYTGHFGDIDGSFKVYAKKSDTLIFGAIGFDSKKVCFADSAYKAQYELDVFLSRLQIRIPEVEVFAPRDLDEIHEDMKSLGYNPKDYRESGVNAMSSPITALYQALSKRERSYRKVIEMENQDRRRDLLRELFVKYVDYDILDLTTVEFDDFISFLNVSDQFMRNSTQYEFVVFVKERFELYKRIKHNQPLNEGDYYYHED